MRREDLKSEILRILLVDKAYGYELAKRFREKTGSVHTGYLYGVLREMEQEGIVQSEWIRGATGPPRRLYRITPAGKESVRLGLILREKKGYVRPLPQVRTAATLAIVALVLTDIVQYLVRGSLLDINIPAGIAVLAFASTITFISLRKAGNWVGWLVSAIALLTAISVLFPPHPGHTWQGALGLVLALVGVAKLSLGLTLLGFTLMLGTFVFHEIVLQMDSGLIHDVYTSSTWLALFAGGLGANALYLYLARGRLVSLGELLSFRKSSTPSGLATADESSIIRAPKQVVWRVLTDMENWPKWLTGENGFRVLAHNIVSAEGNVIVCDEIAQVSGRKIWSRDKYTLYPEETIEETFIEGPLRGRLVFTLQETPGGTRVNILTEMSFKGLARFGALLGGRKVHSEIQAGFFSALAKAVES